MRRVHLRQAFGRAGEVELDDLGRAGAHEEQLTDVGAAAEEALDLAVELVMGVGHAGEIALFEDRGAEAGLGEDHDARGRLQEVRAGPRAHDEEEGVLHLAVEPDDAGEAAEDLALATFLQDGGIAAGGGLDLGGLVHGRALRFEAGHPQFPEELTGVDHVGGIGRQRDPHLRVVGPAREATRHRSGAAR
jgi:hypothetical protein